MSHTSTTHLNPKKRYLQIALNSTLEEAEHIIRDLPVSDRILVEAGTPLIKRYGAYGIKKIHGWYAERLGTSGMLPYVVADLKTMDRGETEVDIAARAGASAAVALGHAPIETLNAFIEGCNIHGLDAMIDMMNVEYPLAVLRELKTLPAVVILHRGVDEEQFNKEKQIPLYEIRRIKGAYDMMIAIAGGDTIREAQRAIFNDADIVAIWKSVFQSSADTAQMVEEFLKEMK